MSYSEAPEAPETELEWKLILTLLIIALKKRTTKQRRKLVDAFLNSCKE